MAKNKTVRLSDEEYAAVQAFRESAKATDAPSVSNTDKVDPTAAQQALADAFVSAIERTRPAEKKTIANRKPNTPWTPKDGSPRLKMKRKFFHHGMIIDDKISNEEIALLNQVKPGAYCDGYVRVTLRKDKGIDIDHPVRTASQRLKLVNQYGIRSFAELLQRIIAEKTDPSKYRKPDDADLYDLD